MPKPNKPKSSHSSVEPVSQQVMSQGGNPSGSHKRSRRSSSLSTSTDDGESGTGSESNSDSEYQESEHPSSGQDSPTDKGEEGVLDTLVQVLKSSITGRPSAKNGLYGDTSVSITLPKMPMLAGPSATQYTDWVTKAINYFQTYGLEEVVTMSPAESLTRAYECDPQTPIGTIKGIWYRLHTRAVGVIKTAVEPVIGTELFDEIEDEQLSMGNCNIYEGDKKDMPWLDTFFSKNAHLVWTRLKNRQLRYTAHDITNSLNKLFSLKYIAGTDPAIFRRYFTTILKELKNADTSIYQDQRVLMSVWYRALPKELEVLKQALGVKTDLKWSDIYEALVHEYSSRGTNKHHDRRPRSTDKQAHGNSEEKAAAAMEGRNKNKSMKKKPRPSFNGKTCNHCKKPGHGEDNCWLKHPHLKPNKFLKTKGTDNDSDTEVYMPFIDSEIMSQFTQLGLHAEVAEEQAMYSNPSSSPVEIPPTYLIFDSAATSHVSHSKRIMNSLSNVPEVSMGTAIRGQGTIIRQRGQLKLNKKYVLKDVAYIPNATANLISEGRLCDAGFEIRKNKDLVTVYKDDTPILVGHRWNRLWVYSTNDSKPIPSPVNTLIQQNSPHMAGSNQENGRVESSSSTTTYTQEKARPKTRGYKNK